jgi:hypothetical protein
MKNERAVDGANNESISKCFINEALGLKKGETTT